MFCRLYCQLTASACPDFFLQINNIQGRYILTQAQQVLHVDSIYLMVIVYSTLLFQGKYPLKIRCFTIIHYSVRTRTEMRTLSLFLSHQLTLKLCQKKSSLSVMAMNGAYSITKLLVIWRWQWRQENHLKNNQRQWRHR